jgi:hypothetical protein
VLDADELRIFVQQTDNDKQNALHRAAPFNTAEVFLKVVEVLKNTLNESEVNEMFEHVDDKPWNVFHLTAFNHKHKGVAASVVIKMKEVIGAERTKIMLKQKDEFGDNPLNVLLNLHFT